MGGNPARYTSATVDCRTDRASGNPPAGCATGGRRSVSRLLGGGRRLRLLQLGLQRLLQRLPHALLLGADGLQLLHLLGHKLDTPPADRAWLSDGSTAPNAPLQRWQMQAQLGAHARCTFRANSISLHFFYFITITLNKNTVQLQVLPVFSLLFKEPLHLTESNREDSLPPWGPKRCLSTIPSKIELATKPLVSVGNQKRTIRLPHEIFLKVSLEHGRTRVHCTHASHSRELRIFQLVETHGNPQIHPTAKAWLNC